MGIQGSLLTVLLEKPVYLKAIIVGSCPFSLECMRRALIERSDKIEQLCEFYKNTDPIVIQSSLLFKDSKLAKNPNSIDNFDTVNENDDLMACPNCNIQVFIKSHFLNYQINKISIFCLSNMLELWNRYKAAFCLSQRLFTGCQ